MRLVQRIFVFAAAVVLIMVAPDGSSKSAAKDLQMKVLVDAHEEHTASGKHVTVLKSWPRARLTPA